MVDILNFTMDLNETDYLILKLTAAFLCAIVVFAIMMKMQARKEADAERKFQMIMKSLELKALKEKQNVEQANKQISDSGRKMVRKD